jgi:hypothetical protein
VVLQGLRPRRLDRQVEPAQISASTRCYTSP